MKNNLWVEEFRPKTYESVLGLDSAKMYELEKNLPHLLFLGPAGVGKTTTMKIIAKRVGCDVLSINASDERKIETIREKVKSFAMTRKSSDDPNKLKIIMLDEFDGMLPLSQQALRNIMESYSSNCRFLLSGNYENNVIDPIKSRCVRVYFSQMKNEDIENRLKYICKKEELVITTEAIKEIIKHSYGDIRNCINTLQELSFLNTPITINYVKKESLILDDLFKLLKEKHFEKARQLLLDNHVSYEQLINDVDNWVSSSDLILMQKIGILRHLCHVNENMKDVINKELLFAGFLDKCIGVLNNA